MAKKSKPGGAPKAWNKASNKVSKKAGAAAARLPKFSLQDKELPSEIEERAFTSGGYPYDKRLKRKKYEKELRRLQIELLKVQNWARDKGERIVIVFEGRDASGKGGTIHRFTQHLNPRAARVVALPKPTDIERGQWYFQRYVAQLPTKGEIVIFDRSWYNRAVVEPVMGFCTPTQTEQFLGIAPEFERMLVEDGIRLVKFWLHIGREMQLKRFHARAHDPLKRWKLGPIDHAAMDKWEAYTDTIDAMLKATHRPHAPWTVVLANDKTRTRLETMRHFLRTVPYPARSEKALERIDRKIVLDGAKFLARGGD
jgi:polyphosphate kinase